MAQASAPGRGRLIGAGLDPGARPGRGRPGPGAQESRDKLERLNMRETTPHRRAGAQPQPLRPPADRARTLPPRSAAGPAGQPATMRSTRPAPPSWSRPSPRSYAAAPRIYAVEAKRDRPPAPAGRRGQRGPVHLRQHRGRPSRSFPGDGPIDLKEGLAGEMIAPPVRCCCRRPPAKVVHRFGQALAGGGRANGMTIQHRLEGRRWMLPRPDLFNM